MPQRTTNSISTRKNPLDNASIAEKLRLMADLLEIEGANPFRVRAYRNAGQTIQDLPQAVHDLLEEKFDLTELPGIGKDLAQKITDITETGTTESIEEVERKVTPGLRRLLKIPGLGPKKIAALHKNLKIDSLEKLKSAAENGLIQKLEGFGEKTEQRILQELAALDRRGPERVLLAQAESYAERLRSYMQSAPGLKNLEIAGSYRRRKETVGDLDLIATGRDPRALMDHFLLFPEIARVVSSGETRSMVILQSGLQVDIRVVPEEGYGAALLYFTGSKAHNIRLRRRCEEKGLKMNEYGVYQGDRLLAGRTEKEVYRFFHLPYIEPELREDRGELEAARERKLPKLVQIEDIRGDLHMHTIASDGRNSLQEMIEAAIERGLEYIAITDHTQRSRIANGLDPKRIQAQMAEIDELQTDYPQIRILKGAEVDILEDGRLDLPNEVLRELDVRVCSIHFRGKLDRERQTERILRAMENPYFHILAHPTGRLINARDPYDVDLEKIFEAARDRGSLLEVNCQPSRMDLSDIYCRLAKDIGVRVVISTDSHSTLGFENLKYGVGQARRGLLEKKDVANTLPLGRFLRLIQ